jgi:hypothetical protein
VHDNSADAVAYASFATSYNPTYDFTDVAGINVSPNMKAAVYGGLLSSEGVSVHTPPFLVLVADTNGIHFIRWPSRSSVKMLPSCSTSHATSRTVPNPAI